jgi:hypothetical protein
MAAAPARAALALPDGTRYEGPVADGELTGAPATYDHPDGSRYVGAVEAGLRHGHGVLTAPGGAAVYDGGWVRGERQGQVRKEGDGRVAVWAAAAASSLITVSRGPPPHPCRAP